MQTVGIIGQRLQPVANIAEGGEDGLAIGGERRLIIVQSGAALGAELAKSVESRADWVGNREAQKSVPRANLVAEIQAMLKGRS